MKAPVLGLYGEADQGIPVAQVEAMKKALQATKTAEFKIYPGAPQNIPPQTLLAVQRTVHSGEIRERFRTLRPREAAPRSPIALHAHARAFTFTRSKATLDACRGGPTYLGLIKTDRTTTDRT